MEYSYFLAQCSYFTDAIKFAILSETSMSQLWAMNAYQETELLKKKEYFLENKIQFCVNRRFLMRAYISTKFREQTEFSMIT